MVIIEHTGGDLDIADPVRVNRYLTCTATLLDHSLRGNRRRRSDSGIAGRLWQNE
jgi:hypothetical protein